MINETTHNVYNVLIYLSTHLGQLQLYNSWSIHFQPFIHDSFTSDTYCLTRDSTVDGHGVVLFLLSYLM
jgi:hypothetical protein